MSPGKRATARPRVGRVRAARAPRAAGRGKKPRTANPRTPNPRTGRPGGILVIDVGGSRVKVLASGVRRAVKFVSGPTLTPDEMVRGVLAGTRGWRYAAVSIGYPGVVRANRIVKEPHNLGTGWVGFDFEAAFGCPVRIMNDAAMQALGDYAGGAMLFLGLGTGLGSALIVEGIVQPLELGHLPCTRNGNYEDRVGKAALQRLGRKHWRREVLRILGEFRQALLPDYIVVGGGNAAKLKQLPPQTRSGTNAAAFRGGFKMWNDLHARRSLAR